MTDRFTEREVAAALGCKVSQVWDRLRDGATGQAIWSAPSYSRGSLFHIGTQHPDGRVRAALIRLIRGGDR
jgi:hypothetical protein